MNTNINIIPGQIRSQVHVSQYDKGRKIELTLYDAQDEYKIPSGTSITIVGTRPDGLGMPDVPATWSGSVVYFETTPAMTAVDGVVMCEAVLLHNTDRISTANFELHVEKAAKAVDTIDADQTVLTSLAERVSALIEESQENIAIAMTAAEDARNQATAAAQTLTGVEDIAAAAAEAAESAAESAQLAASFNPEGILDDIARLRNQDGLEEGYVWATTESGSGWEWPALTVDEVSEIWEEVWNA